MIPELRLFRLPAAVGRLGPSQERVLVELRARGGLEDVDAGRVVHALRYGDGHDRGDPRGCCAYAAADGRAVLVSLRRRGLVRRRCADGLWLPLDDRGRIWLPAGEDQGEIPW